jgi:hypothetical protein
MKIKDLFAYLQERFPVVNMALFAILFLTVYAVAIYFHPEAGGFGWREVLGMLATISFFFRLRVFDEIKDYNLDAINHPNRVLQSGRVNLKSLKTIAYAGIALEIIWSVLMGIPALVCWLLVFGYSLLMRYEFWISDFLKKRLVLYAIMHMLIMPLIILWIWSAYTPGFEISKHYLLLAALSLLGGFSFEIARKIHAPEAERELVDSYSKAIGFRGAIATVLVILLAGIITQSYLLNQLHASMVPFLVLDLLYLVTLYTYVRNLSEPNEGSLRKAELLVSLFMLVSYLSIILVVLL